MQRSFSFHFHLSLCQVAHKAFLSSSNKTSLFLPIPIATKAGIYRPCGIPKIAEHDIMVGGTQVYVSYEQEFHLYAGIWASPGIFFFKKYSCAVSKYVLVTSLYLCFTMHARHLMGKIYCSCDPLCALFLQCIDRSIFRFKTHCAAIISVPQFSWTSNFQKDSISLTSG